MKVEIQDAGPCQKKVNVELDAKQVKEKIDQAFRDLQKMVALPGFRKGKVPRHILEKRFGKEIREQVKMDLISESLEEILEEKGLKLAADPRVEEESLDEGKGFSFTTLIEVLPEFDLPEYKGIELERPKFTFSEEDVERELQAFFENTNKTFVSVEAPSQKGDMVIVNLKVQPEEGEEESLEEVSLFLPKEFPKGSFFEAFLGKKAGEKIEWKGEIPDLPKVKAKGKQGSVQGEVLEVKRPKYEAPCEEWAKELDYESLEEVKRKILENLKQEAEREAEREVRRQLKEKLLEQVRIDLPPTLVQRALYQEFEYHAQMLHYFGVPEQEIVKALTEEKEKLQEKVEFTLRSSLLLDKIAEKEKIYITESELQSHVEEMARERGVDPGELWDDLEEKGELSYLRRNLRRKATVEKLLEWAKITTKEQPFFSKEKQEQT